MSSSTDSTATATKNVLQMSINGDEPPQAYVVDDSVDCQSSFGEIPIIDVGVFLPSSSPEPEELDSELRKLKSALSKEGCFQAIGHGISNSLLDKMLEISKEFFELPEEEKLKNSPTIEQIQGYGNDVVVSEKQVLDWNYRLFLRVLPHDSIKLHLWPQNPNDFRETLHEYTDNIKSVMEVLYRAIAKSLNIDEDSFVSQLGDELSLNARFNFYPPCSRPDMVLGVKAHTDGSALTVLLQDNAIMEGFQVFVDEKWVKVHVLPHALIVNVGDQMQIMSNGILKSTLHRAVTNSERLRISLAMFHIPDEEREIGPLEALVDEERPKKYKTIKNYGAINYECYQKGVVPIDSLKIW